MAHPEIDAVIAAFYAAFDNRGLAPDASPLVALFAPEARITRVADGRADTWSPEEFAAPRVAMLTDGTLTAFHEWETAEVTTVFRHVASRWSTYEKEGTLNGAAYGGTGTKLIQLRRDGGRWLISSLLWEDA